MSGAGDGDEAGARGSFGFSVNLRSTLRPVRRGGGFINQTLAKTRGKMVWKEGRGEEGRKRRRRGKGLTVTEGTCRRHHSSMRSFASAPPL
jgi:hypothetical protein